MLAGICLTGAGVLAQSAGIDAIQAYAGTWKTQMEHFDTAYSKAGKESSTLRNDCWKSGGYYVCDQFVNGESKALIVFTYNDKDKTYYDVSDHAGRRHGRPRQAGDRGECVDVSVGEHREREDDIFPGGEHVHGSEQDRVPAGVFDRQAELDADGEGVGGEGVASQTEPLDRRPYRAASPMPGKHGVYAAWTARGMDAGRLRVSFIAASSIQMNPT